MVPPQTPYVNVGDCPQCLQEPGRGYTQPARTTNRFVAETAIRAIIETAPDGLEMVSTNSVQIDGSLQRNRPAKTLDKLAPFG